MVVVYFKFKKYYICRKKSEKMNKIPPQAIDFEEAVLGALILEKNAVTRVIDMLQPEMFYNTEHKEIYSAIQSLFFDNKPIDQLTVINKLKETNNLDRVGGAYNISRLTNKISSSANIEYHARILIQKHIKRELIRVGSEIISDAYDDSQDDLSLLDKAGEKIFKISSLNFRNEYKGMEELAQEAILSIEKMQSSDSGLRGVPSGFRELDGFTSGWQKSDLIVLAARPGMGKTSFAIQLARNASDKGFPAAIFSLEMSDRQLMNRLIVSESEIYSDKIKTGNLNEFDWDKINRGIASLIDKDIFIDDTPSLSVFELRAKARRLKEQKGIELIVIDYIQLMTVGNHTGNRETEISTISRSLKSIAKELDIPIIVLSQLNRSVETRGDKHPLLSDLRESGAIEQDADVVLFLYRPEYYGIETLSGESLNGLAEVIIAKHREGSLGTIEMQFKGEYTKFCDKQVNTF